MEKLANLNENEVIELWQQPQALTQEETSDCGDVALLWHLAERLDLVHILDQSRMKNILEEHKASKFIHVQVVKPRHTKQFELRIQPRKRVLKRGGLQNSSRRL